MNTKYHIQLCQEALTSFLSAQAIKRIYWANIRQDWGLGILNDRFHFDGGNLQAASEYIETQRELAAQAILQNNDPKSAWQAFGRLLHCRQDFYAHTNYVHLWVESHQGLTRPEQLPLCHKPLDLPGLFTSKTNLLVFLAYRLPKFGDWLRSWYLPPDEHEAINLDHPQRGPLYHFAFSAAMRHTIWEWEQLRLRLLAGGEEAVRLFTQQPQLQMEPFRKRTIGIGD